MYKIGKKCGKKSGYGERWTGLYMRVAEDAIFHFSNAVENQDNREELQFY